MLLDMQLSQLTLTFKVLIFAGILFQFQKLTNNKEMNFLENVTNGLCNSLIWQVV